MYKCSDQSCTVDLHIICYFTVVQNGFTPLHIGAKKNRIDIVLILLRRGMDPDVTTQVREHSALFIPTHELSQERLDFVFLFSITCICLFL